MALPGRRPISEFSGGDDSVSLNEQYDLLIGRAMTEFRELDILAMRVARRATKPVGNFSLEVTQVTLDAIHLSFDEAVVLTLIGEFAQAHTIFTTVSAQSDRSAQRLPASVVIFAALAIAHILPNSNFLQRLKLRGSFNLLRRQLLSLSKSSRETIRHKIVFLDALYHAMHHRPVGLVITRLEDALYLARVQGDSKDEACIAEYLGRYLLAQHCPTLAASALTAARDAYNKWGLTAKVVELEALLQVSPLFFTKDRR